MLEEKERIALYTLMKIPGMYPARLNAMYAFTESFAQALRVSEKEYLNAGIFQKVTEPGRFDVCRNDEDFLAEAAASYRRLSGSGVRMLDYTEADMPASFLNLKDPPKVLFVKGRLPEEGIPSVSMIGSRNCSDYGKTVSRFFGRKLGEAGVCIISGMAAGIDTASLEGGLDGGAACFAVLGSGVNICYPRSSRTVYNRILGSGGGILSEYCPDEPALGYHFVTRNRLIAALGDVLLVLEAKEKSGTAITVENALEQGKDIFALPGRITDPLGFGCNRLLREGAMVLTCPEDVLEYLGIESPGTAEKLRPVTPSCITPKQKKLLSLLGPEPLHLEELALEAGYTLQDTAALLGVLELAGAVQAAGNAYYIRAYQ